MAHVKNHDYHILNPSLWPFIGAVAAFIMLFGAVLFFHGNGPWLLLIGLVGVLYVMFGWWADTVSENKDGDHTPVVLIGLRYGFILFIMSEVMFFAAWFWSFFKHAMYPMSDQSPIVDGVWPPVGIETFDPWHLPLINTLILLQFYWALFLLCFKLMSIVTQHLDSAEISMVLIFLWQLDFMVFMWL